MMIKGKGEMVTYWVESKANRVPPTKDEVYNSESGRQCLCNHVQGVPRNITVARQFETCILFLNLFETFSRQPLSMCMILKTITTKMLLVPGFPKCGLPFL